MVSCRDAAYDHHEDFDKCYVISWFQMQQTYHKFLNLAYTKSQTFMVDKLLHPQKVGKNMLKGSP